MERSRRIRRISEGKKLTGYRNYRDTGSRKGDMMLLLLMKINSLNVTVKTLLQYDSFISSEAS